MEFYLKKFNYLKTPDEPDINFVQPIERRRLAKSDKYTLSTLYKCYTADIQNIIYSSKIGETERLLKIIAQYKTNLEASPSIFSGSVHNHAVGLFLQQVKNPVPYNALTAFNNSISQGILTAMISKYNKVLFCYTNTENDIFESFSLNISKEFEPDTQKFVIKFKTFENIDDSFDEFIELFQNKKDKIKTPMYEIERAE